MKTAAKRETRTATMLILAAVLGCIPVAGVALADDGDVVGRVGNTDIKASEVRLFLDTLDPRQQAAIAGTPNLLGQAVRQMLAQRAVLKEAVAKKWEQQPGVKAQLDRARDAALTESYLASVSMPPANYPSDAELQNAYQANQAAFLAPRQYQLAQVYVAVARDADKAADSAARAKLDKIQKRLKQPRADFAAIAREESEDQATAKQGGEMSWLFENQINPEIRSLVLGLAKGAVAEAVRLDDGWHIIKLLDTKPAYTRPIAEVRDQLVRQMRADRAQELRRIYLARLLEQYPVAINELALEKLLTKPGK